MINVRLLVILDFPFTILDQWIVSAVCHLDVVAHRDTDRSRSESLLRRLIPEAQDVPRGAQQIDRLLQVRALGPAVTWLAAIEARSSVWRDLRPSALGPGMAKLPAVGTPLVAGSCLLISGSWWSSLFASRWRSEWAPHRGSILAKLIQHRVKFANQAALVLLLVVIIVVVVALVEDGREADAVCQFSTRRLKRVHGP
jgi:hypothetical protein